MASLFQWLYFIFFFGLLLLALLLSARTNAWRKALYIAGLLLVNLSAAFLLFSGYLVARLDGSRPPSLGEFLLPLWLPIMLILVLDVMIAAANRRVRAWLQGEKYHRPARRI